MIWDDAPIHHCRPVKDFLTAAAAARLHLERLPGYAPEINPDEGVWNLLKRVELKNRCRQNLDEVRWELGLAIRRLRRRLFLPLRLYSVIYAAINRTRAKCYETVRTGCDVVPLASPATREGPACR